MPRPERLEDAVLVTHKGCMDGAGCAIMFLNAGGKRENIKLVPAGMVERFIKDDPVFQSPKFLIFADVGVTLPKYADILEKRGNLVLLDHHRTSLHMKGRPWALVDAEGNGGTRCGTMLMRDYLIEEFPDEGRFVKSSSFRRFAEVIDDHDRWIRKIPDSEEFATFMVFVGQEDFITRFQDPKARVSASIATGRGPSFWTPFEKDLLGILDRRRDQAIAESLKKTQVRDVTTPDGRVVRVGYVISDEPNTSLLLNQMLIDRNEIQVACQIMFDIGKVSLRSRGDFDVSEFAKLYGGGGHTAAAGHMIPGTFINELIDGIH